MPEPGDVVTVDFAGATGMKRRPAVVVSSALYHAHRPDVILGFLPSHATAGYGSPTKHPKKTTMLLEWYLRRSNHYVA